MREEARDCHGELGLVAPYRIGRGSPESLRRDPASQRLGPHAFTWLQFSGTALRDPPPQGVKSASEGDTSDLETTTTFNEMSATCRLTPFEGETNDVETAAHVD